MQTSQPPRELTVAKAKFAAASIAVSPLVYVAVVAAMKQTRVLSPVCSATVGWIVLGVSLVPGLVSLTLASILLSPEAARRAPDGNTMQRFFSATLTVVAMAEVPAIGGLVGAFLSGELWIVIAGAIAGTLLAVLHFPTQRRYDDMCAGLETIPDHTPAPEGDG